MKNIYLVFNILALLAMASCKHEATNETYSDENMVEISKEQFQSENMELCKVEKVEINDKLAFTGIIVPKINGMAMISAPVSGKIVAVKISEGQHVKANDILLKVGGSGLLDLQQAYASSAAKIKQLKSDYRKTKQLYEENIKTETEYMLAESDYKIELANYSALKIKLENIGLNLSKIENGEYATAYSIKSSISGQISELKIVRGQYVSSDTEMLGVVDNCKTELHLSLFEKDIPKLNIGQMLQFWSIGKNSSKSSAKISRIGGKLNSNIIDCFASIDNNTCNYVINQMVNGEITVSSDSVDAISKNAVFTIGQNHYILLKKYEDENKFKFEKKKISTGKSSGDYIEILDVVNDEILSNGTYNISIE